MSPLPEEKTRTMEETRHQQLMEFMSSFRTSMEEKLENRLGDVNNEMKAMNLKIDNNEEKNEGVLKRMEDRLSQLEVEMKRLSELRDRREELKKKEQKELARKEKEEVSTVREEEKEDKQRKKRFTRRHITEQDLTKDTEENADVRQQFKSTWAMQIEEQLSSAASLSGMEIDRRVVNHPISPNGKDLQEKRLPWELLEGVAKTKERKVRKPPVVRNWFADEPGCDDCTSSSDTLEETGAEWSEVEKKKKRLLKRRQRREKRHERMSEVASKMQHMVGIGPIRSVTIDYFQKKTGSLEEARRSAIREYLSYKLDFSDKELDKMEIKETKSAAKEDILYFALAEKEDIKEIHYRRAACGNDDLVVRDYIPPSTTQGTWQ